MPTQISKNWQVGDVILDLYQVLEVIGDNTVASIYKVRHLGWNAELLVQVFQPKVVQQIGGQENFQAQMKAWVDLGMHPHLVTCYYVRSLERTCLILTELVTGSTLHDAIRQGHLYQESSAQNLRRILDIAIQSAWGLDYIHENGKIHQNICPANLLLSADGVVKLTNLGMVYGRSMGTQAADSANADEDFVLQEGMTSAYCSPEQTKLQSLTPSTDSWSWGLLVLEMFQGQRTWSGGTSAAQALKNYQDYQQRRVSPEVPPMPGEVNWLLRRCFRKNPSERPTFAEIATELTKIYLHVVGVPYPRRQPNTNCCKKATPDNLNNKALSYLDLGAKARALQLWEQALKIQPSHRESIYNRGLVLWRSGRISDQALVSTLENLHRPSIRDSLVDYLLSLVHLERDDAPRALELLEKISSISSPFSPLWRDSAKRTNGANRATIQAALEVAREFTAQERTPGREGEGDQGRCAKSEPQKESPRGMGLIRTFEDHTNLVKSVCFAGNGRYALSGSDHNTLKLWDVQTGECLRTFSGHTQEVKCVCISGDGKYAISTSWDRTLKLWDVETGTCLRSFPPSANEIFTISLSFDGVYALSGSSDRFDLWQVHTGECLRSFAGHKGDIFSLALSRDGKYALSGSLDKTIKLWDIHTGNCIQTLHGHQKEVTSVCLSADGNYALSGSSDHTLKLWQLSTGDCLQTLFGHTGEVTSVCLTSDRNYALSGSSDHTIRLWQLSTGRCWRTFEGHTSAVTDICLSPDDTLALSGSMDDTIRLWSVRPPDPPYQAPMRLCLGQSSSQSLSQSSSQSLSQSLSQSSASVLDLNEPGQTIAAAEQVRLLRGNTAPGSDKTTPGIVGWSEPKGVKGQLETMAASWQWLSPLTPKVPDESEGEGTQLTFCVSDNQEAEEQGSGGAAGLLSPAPEHSCTTQDAPQDLSLPTVILTLESGPFKGRKFQFTSRTTCVIGREKDCYPQMPNDPSHQTISRYHCLLDINPPAIRVRDLSSRNGTFVNGKIIGKRAQKTTEFESDLNEGDQIKLGYTPLRVQIYHPEPQPGNRSIIRSQGGLFPGESASSTTFPVVKGYTTLKFLGQGRVSQVYLVRHNETGKLLALKVMQPQGAFTPEALAIFLRDLEHLKALDHPNIVQIYDYGYWGDRFFLTLEYCQGGTVAKVMQQRGTCLSIDESLGIIWQVLDGFDYAHHQEVREITDAKSSNIWRENNGFIHGNLKPSNIFFAGVADKFSDKSEKVNGNSVLVKLGDYALDKAFDLAGLSGLTMTGEQANRPFFTCRQQVLDIKCMQTDLDIWAAAASLYFMLTGQFARDFTGQDPWLVVLQTKPIPIRDRNPNIPKALAELIDLALVDRPHTHFKKAAAFKRALEAVI